MEAPASPASRRPAAPRAADAGARRPAAPAPAPSPANAADDDGYCGVCGSAHSEEGDALLFCDGPGCGVAVHQLCYGIRALPPEDEPWFCEPCHCDSVASAARAAPASPPGRARRRPRLPAHGARVRHLRRRPRRARRRRRGEDPPRSSGGTPKSDAKTRDVGDAAWQDAWAHVACAAWIEEAGFADERRLSVALCGDLSRRALRCELCGKRGQAVQCRRKKCVAAFHPACVLRELMGPKEWRRGGGGAAAGGAPRPSATCSAAATAARAAGPRRPAHGRSAEEIAEAREEKEQARLEKLLKRADRAVANAVADDAKHANRERRHEDARRHALEQAVLQEQRRILFQHQAILRAQQLEVLRQQRVQEREERERQARRRPGEVTLTCEGCAGEFHPKCVNVADADVAAYGKPASDPDRKILICPACYDANRKRGGDDAGDRPGRRRGAPRRRKRCHGEPPGSARGGRRGDDAAVAEAPADADAPAEAPADATVEVADAEPPVADAGGRPEAPLDV
ncbi:SET domain-containing protein [Aureococcus anophagefferens]|nr:SET domain-containing protein [Aureococcus anophagefferens]